MGYYTELNGEGDLRLYGFFQFYPMLSIAYLLLIPGQKPKGSIYKIFGYYALAKICERYDREMYAWLPLSGHTLKHFAAAIATYYMVEDFKLLNKEGNTQGEHVEPTLLPEYPDQNIA